MVGNLNALADLDIEREIKRNIIYIRQTKKAHKGLCNVYFKDKSYDCTMSSGLTVYSSEVQEKIPISSFLVTKIYYRSDKVKYIDKSSGIVHKLDKQDALCFEKGRFFDASGRYCNGQIINLWRDDDLYDVVIMLNDKVIMAIDNNLDGIGRAIGLKKSDMIKIVSGIRPHTKAKITKYKPHK